MIHFILYWYHRMMRKVYHRPGRWQTAKFEKHHKAMKHHRNMKG